MMLFIVKVILLISVLYIIKVLLFPFFKPLSKKQKKGARSYLKEKKAIEKKEKNRIKKQYLAQKYFGKLVGTADRIRYNKIIERLELESSPEELRLTQVTYVSITLIITLIMFSANRTLGFITCLSVILAWIYPITELEEKIEEKDKNIAFDFPAFYSMIYYQYSKSVNLHLSDVIRDYLPNANKDMAEELGIMIDNIDYGEEHALKQFKRRIPLHYVIKFCDIMETRLRGYDNVTQMTFLKNEIDEFRILNLEKELDSRKESNERIQFILIIVLGIYISIYFIFNILESIQIFQ